MFYCKVLGDLYPGLPWILIIFPIFCDMTFFSIISSHFVFVGNLTYFDLFFIKYSRCRITFLKQSL